MKRSEINPDEEGDNSIFGRQEFIIAHQSEQAKERPRKGIGQIDEVPSLYNTSLPTENFLLAKAALGNISACLLCGRFSPDARTVRE